MKRAMLWILALVVVAGVTGCKHWQRRHDAQMGDSCAQAPDNCQACEAACDASCDASCESCEEPAKCHRNADGPGFFKPGCLCKQGGNMAEGEAAQAGPATGAVTYPYYTTRGPRDFLAKNPPSIGP